MVLELCTFFILHISKADGLFLLISYLELLHTYVLYKEILTDQFCITEDCLNKLHE